MAESRMMPDFPIESECRDEDILQEDEFAEDDDVGDEGDEADLEE
jgi:hypothetical protein